MNRHATAQHMQKNAAPTLKAAATGVEAAMATVVTVEVCFATLID